MHAHSGWIDVTGQVCSGGLTLAKVDEGNDGVILCILFTLSVCHDFWTIVRNGKTFGSDSSLLSTMPATIASVQDLLLVSEFLNSLVPCCGNNYKKFLPLVE